MTVKRYKNSPNTTDVNNLLFQKVKITLFNGDVYEGYLRKTGDQTTKKNLNISIPKNYYFVSTSKFVNITVKKMIFRVSHIVTIEWTENSNLKQENNQKIKETKWEQETSK